MKTIEEFIKEVLTKSKHFLQQNDLETTYVIAVDFMQSNSLPKWYIGALTEFLINNGITVIDYFNTIIPPCCFGNIKAPSDSGKLILPDNIEEICTRAYTSSKGFHTADLRHIEVVGKAAFSFSSLKKVYINPNTKFIDYSTFELSDLELVYLPKDNFEKHCSWFLKKFYLDYEPKFREY